MGSSWVVGGVCPPSFALGGVVIVAVEGVGVVAQGRAMPKGMPLLRDDIKSGEYVLAQKTNMHIYIYIYIYIYTYIRVTASSAVRWPGSLTNLTHVDRRGARRGHASAAAGNLVPLPGPVGARGAIWPRPVALRPFSSSCSDRLSVCRFTAWHK